MPIITAILTFFLKIWKGKDVVGELFTDLLESIKNSKFGPLIILNLLFQPILFFVAAGVENQIESYFAVGTMCFLAILSIIVFTIITIKNK